MITKGKSSYIPYLKKIWKECFKDNDSYIDFFFNNRYSDDSVVVKIVDGIPVAMLFVFYANLILNGVCKKVGYVYAVSTLEKYRGRGISTELMEYANKNFDLDGTFLVPASESLFKFYEDRGYNKAFYLKEVSFDVFDSDKNIHISYGVEPSEYKLLRDNMFSCDGYVYWGEEALEYALKENEFVGGKNYSIFYNGNKYAVIGYIDKDRFFARESVIADGDLKDVLNLIAKKEGCKSVYTRIDVKRNVEGNDIPFGSIKGIDGVSNGYFNIALD